MRMSRIPPTLDMTPDGSFRRLPAPGPSLSLKFLVGAVLLAVIAGSVAVAAFALWLFSMVLPVLVLAGVGAWGMVKYRQWQLVRANRNLRAR